MSKKIDPKVKERHVLQMMEHVAEYPNPTGVAQFVAKRNGVGAESVRRWHFGAQLDSGQRRGATSEELVEIQVLRARVRRLGGDNDILCRAAVSCVGEIDPRVL